MEQYFQCIDQWLFDYAMYRYVEHFITDPLRPTARFRSKRLCSVMKELIHVGLEEIPPNKRKAHLLLLVFTLKEIEEIFLGQQDTDSEECVGEIAGESRPNLSKENCDTIHSLLEDMQIPLTLFTDELEAVKLKILARKCLVDNLVMRFQFSLRTGSDGKEVLEMLKKLVDESADSDEKESYRFCCNLKPVSGKFRPMPEFISNIKKLINIINTCFEIPHLIQFAMSTIEDSSVLLGLLLQDQRPSRKADVMKFSLGLTDNRKQELDQLMLSLEAGEDLRPMSEVDQRLQATTLPSTASTSRTVTSEKASTSRTVTSEIDQQIQASTLPSAASTSRTVTSEKACTSRTVTSEVHQRTQATTLSSTSRTLRSEVDQSIQPSILPSIASTSRTDREPTIRPSTHLINPEVDKTSNASPTRDQSGSTYMSTLGKKLKEFHPEDCRIKLRKMDEALGKSKKFCGPPSRTSVRLGPWLPDEEKLFIEETLKIGVGNWAAIKEVIGSARSSQQLKDKWRNINKNLIREMARKLNISYP